MAVTKPRNRLVNFRVSEEEFQTLREACLQGGARSISDFARSAVLNTFGGSGEAEGQLKIRLSTIDQKMDELDSSLRTLLGRLSSPSPQATLDVLEERLLHQHHS
jgi:hypothetical protein